MFLFLNCSAFDGGNGDIFVQYRVRHTSTGVSYTLTQSQFDVLDYQNLVVTPV
jgi:hypothetical protein